MSAEVLWPLVVLALGGMALAYGLVRTGRVPRAVRLAHLETRAEEIAASLLALENRFNELEAFELNRLTALETKINDPTNGLAEQIRTMRNVNRMAGK